MTTVQLLTKTALLLLLSMMVGLPALATSINGAQFKITQSADGHYSIERLLLSTPLFEISPFSASKSRTIPGFADPLGTGVDAGLRIFSGKVHNMDVLGDFAGPAYSAITDVELPAGSVSGEDLLSVYLSQYLSVNARAFDYAVLDLGRSQINERNGLPVTPESSPLSLVGFGTVDQYLKPVFTHWTKCPARAKRERVMTEIPGHIRQKWQPNPVICYLM